MTSVVQFWSGPPLLSRNAGERGSSLPGVAWQERRSRTGLWLALTFVSLLKALVNVDTSLPMMFLGLRKLGNIVADTKCFWTKSETFFVSRTQNCCARGQTGKRLCRQRCVRNNHGVLVCQGLNVLWPKQASSVLKFRRRKRSFQWHPDHSDRLSGAWNIHENAQKFECKTQRKISYDCTWLLHGKNCPSRWCFLRIFFNWKQA